MHAQGNCDMTHASTVGHRTGRVLTLGESVCRLSRNDSLLGRWSQVVHTVNHLGPPPEETVRADACIEDAGCSVVVSSMLPSTC